PEGTQSEGTIGGAGGPLLLYLKLCGVVSVVATSPLWLYQIWAFILPGLHAHERKWTRVFAAIAGPLFIAGVVVGYVTLPKGLEVL
ncbi:twin-arginine translocase subunit TatC, partial [Escherichia coli]|uniref:twin-arginine translocase subunit TatC n=1 Tax=Escherichia coli TaxID=562 RepID=UPI003F26FC8D